MWSIFKRMAIEKRKIVNKVARPPKFDLIDLFPLSVSPYGCLNRSRKASESSISVHTLLLLLVLLLRAFSNSALLLALYR